MVQRSESQAVEPTPQPLAVNEVPVEDVTVPETKLEPNPPRDGTIVGPAVYSSEHCPLLVAKEDVIERTVVEQHTGADGEPAGRTVHLYPEHVLTNPVKCPSCGIMREAHGLLLNTETGERDCAIAIQQKRNPKYTSQFGADAAARAQVNADSQDPNSGPAAAGNLQYAGKREPLDTRNIAGENLADDAKANIEARSATPSSKHPLTEDQDGKTLAGDRRAYELNTLRDAQGAK